MGAECKCKTGQVCNGGLRCCPEGQMCVGGHECATAIKPSDYSNPFKNMVDAINQTAAAHEDAKNARRKPVSRSRGLPKRYRPRFH